MDLIKKNIHMNREKANVYTQVVLEEDVNISDQKPDAKRIITQKGKVQIEDVQKGTDRTIVKGNLEYAVLYLTDEENARPCFIKGVIPFEETLHMEGVDGTEEIRIYTAIEDLQAGLINSRKVSIQALLGIQIKAEELYDEELVADIISDDAIAMQKNVMDVTSLAVNMKDLYRVREEVELPSGMPNIYDIIWTDYALHDMDFRVMEGQIAITGELHMFILYEGEEEEDSIQYFECARPFSGNLSLSDCRENMIDAITHDVEHMEIEPRTDYDGEERVFAIDMALNIYVRLLENHQIQVVDDLYGYKENVESIKRPSLCNALVSRNTAKKRIQENIVVSKNRESITQILHVNGELIEKNTGIKEDEVKVTGVWKAMVLAKSTGKEGEIICQEKNIPYEIIVPLSGIVNENDKENTMRVTADTLIERMDATILKNNEIELKAVIKTTVNVFAGKQNGVLSEVKITPFLPNSFDKTPGMAVYFAKKGDTLWNVGKQYRVPLDELRTNNHLSKDSLEQGQKILVVKTLV